MCECCEFTNVWRFGIYISGMQIWSLFRSVLDYESMPEYKVKIRVNTLSAFINPKETKI